MSNKIRVLKRVEIYSNSSMTLEVIRKGDILAQSLALLLTQVIFLCVLLYKGYNISCYVMIASMLSNIMVQWRRKYKTYLEPLEYFKYNKERPADELKDNEQLIMDVVDTQDQIVKSLDKNNKVMIKWLSLSLVLYMISVVIVAIII
jgi:hypothetical protein